MVRNETQAEDLTQETLVKIWKGLPGYHGGASLSTWIYTIARNTCLTELKKRACCPALLLGGKILPGSQRLACLAPRHGEDTFISRKERVAPAEHPERWSIFKH